MIIIHYICFYNKFYLECLLTENITKPEIDNIELIIPDGTRNTIK